MMWQKDSADRLWYQTAFEQGTDDYRPLTAFGGAALGSGVEMEPVDWKDEAASKHDSEAAVFLMGFALAILGFDDQGEHGEALGELISAVKQFKDFNDDGSQYVEPSEPPIPTGKIPTGEPVEASSKNPSYVGSGEDSPCPHDWQITKLIHGVLYETCRLCDADRSGPPIPDKPGGPPRPIPSRPPDEITIEICVVCGGQLPGYDEAIQVRTDEGRRACCSNECYQKWKSTQPDTTGETRTEDEEPTDPIKVVPGPDGEGVELMTHKEFVEKWGDDIGVVKPEDVSEYEFDLARTIPAGHMGVDMAKGESQTIKQPMRRVPAVSGAEETWEPDGPPIIKKSPPGPASPPPPEKDKPVA